MSTQQKPNTTLQILFVAIVTIGTLAYIIANTPKGTPAVQATPSINEEAQTETKPTEAVKATNPGQEPHPTTGGQTLPEITPPPKKGLFQPKKTVKIEKLQPTNTEKAPTETPPPTPGTLETSTPGTPGDMQTNEPTNPEELKGGFVESLDDLDKVDDLDPEIKANECQKAGLSMTACNDGNKSKKY
jgi:hypothetical protein